MFLLLLSSKGKHDKYSNTTFCNLNASSALVCLRTATYQGNNLNPMAHTKSGQCFSDPFDNSNVPQIAIQNL